MIPLQGESVREFQFLDAPPAWVVALVIIPALALIIGSIYRREAASATSRAKWLLGGLRVAAILIVLGMLFQPVIRSQVFSVSKSMVAVLIDESASMDRRESYEPDLAEALAEAAGLEAGESVESVNRTELIRRVLGSGEGSLVEQLREKVEVEFVGFSAGIRDLADLDELQSDGEATAVGDAMLAALNEYRHKNLAALVVISDGQSNAGRDSGELARAASAEGVPVHTVAVGNPQRPRNIAVLDVEAPDVALVDDEVAVEVTVHSEGYDGDTAELVVRERHAGEALASASFVLSGGDEQTETLYFKPTREGEYLLEVKVPVRSDEQFEDDNVRLHAMQVKPEVIKVLYVEGLPRWEYRFLKNHLLRAENFRVQCLLTSASKEFIQESTDGVPALTRFPPTRQDLFEYDVIILGDIAPEDIDSYRSRRSTRDLLQELAEFVEVGGGLVMIAGELHSPRDYRETPIADVLPVEIGNPEEEERYKESSAPFRPHLPDPLRPHAVVRLEKDVERNLQLLEDESFGLAPMRWYAPVQRKKPGATVLLEHPINGNRHGPHILMATANIPDGWSMFIGFDETWLWRRPYGDRYTERFWRSAVRHVAIGKLRRSDKRFDLRTDKERYLLRDTIQLSARILDQEFRPDSGETCVIRMQQEDASIEDLVGYRQGDGLFERSLRADRPGTYRFWLEDASQPDQRLSLRTVEVEIPRLEILHPELDRGRLEGLADVSGGTCYGLHEFGRLVDELEGNSRRIPIRTEQRDLWDRWSVLAIAMALLTAEWALRKRFNLL